MNFFSKKLRQIEKAQANESVNLAKETSDKAVDVIKELSGASMHSKRKLADNLIVFTNASGGTGASTLASNVAYMAMRKNIKVLLIDLNILCPVQHAYLNIKQEMEKPDLVSFLLGRNSLSDSINTSNAINAIYSNNRTLNDELNCNSKIAIENFTSMLHKVRQYYDLVIVDCPMRIDAMLSNVMMYEADAIYMVWDEGISSAINTEKLRRNMALSGIDSFTKMRVILNKRTSVSFSNYPIKKMNLELVEVLPFTIDVIENSTKGQIYCNKGTATTPTSGEFARKVEQLTDKILKIGGYVE